MWANLYLSDGGLIAKYCGALTGQDTRVEGKGKVKHRNFFAMTSHGLAPKGGLCGKWYQNVRISGLGIIVPIRIPECWGKRENCQR